MGAVSSTLVEERNPIQGKRPNWMGELIKAEPEKFGNLRMHQIVLPGTHNSATYEVEHTYISSLAKCQKHEVMLQLKSGVRWIDVRISDDASEGVIRVSHRFQCMSLGEILHQIYSFLLEHKGEVVILAIKKDWDRGLSPEGKQKALQMLLNYFDKFLISSDQIATMSIKELVDKNLRLHIISETLDDVLDVSEMEQSWCTTNSTDTETLIAKLSNYEHTEHHKKLKVLDCYLTPSAESITRWSLKNINWHQLQNDNNDYVLAWLKQQAASKHSFNIIAVDMINQEIIDFLIGLNPNPNPPPQ